MTLSKELWGDFYADEFMMQTVDMSIQLMPAGRLSENGPLYSCPSISKPSGLESFS